MQLPDLGDDLVEEVAVVADDDHRDRLPGQVVLEPGGRLDVEVVRGLVQEHQVGAFQEQLGEHQPRLLAARERPRGASEVCRGEAEAAKDLLDAVVDRVGVLVFELVVQFAVAAGGAVAVGVVLGLGHLLRGLLQLALEVDESRPAPTVATSIKVCVGREVGLLPEQADPDARPDVEVAVIGLVVPGQEPASGSSCRRRWGRPGRSAPRRGPRTSGPGRSDRPRTVGRGRGRKSVSF